VVSLSNKFVVWLAYVAGKLRLFIVLLPIIALTVIITGYLIRPATNYPIFCLDGWRRVALLLESF